MIVAPPFPDETATSFSWRVARECSMSLHQFMVAALGMRGNQLNTDLDQTILDWRLRALAEIAGVRGSVVRELAIPARWRCTTWNPATRRHNAYIFVCPECLGRTNGYAHRIWRTRVGVVCTLHQRWLVGACGACGESLRYFACGFGVASAPWLDAWPFCPACGELIEAGEKIPSWMSYWARSWEDTVDSGSDELSAALTEKILTYVGRAPEIVATVARRAGVPTYANRTGAIAALTLAAYHGQVHLQRTREGKALFSFLVGSNTEAEPLIAILTQVANECSPS